MTNKAKATPVVAMARETDVEKIDATNTHVITMKASSNWVNAPASVQTATTAWSSAASAMATNATAISQLRRLWHDALQPSVAAPRRKPSALR